MKQLKVLHDSVVGNEQRAYVRMRDGSSLPDFRALIASWKGKRIVLSIAGASAPGGRVRMGCPASRRRVERCVGPSTRCGVLLR